MSNHILVIQFLIAFMSFLRIASSYKIDYVSYNEMIGALKLIELKFPKIIKYSTASELWPNIRWTKPNYMCNSNEFCQIPIIQIGRQSKISSSTPELFFSGAVHGDEAVGPQIIYQLILLLCEAYGKEPTITYLVDHRSIYFMPFANAYGYAHNIRTEMGIDPNRDFPYMKQQDCMQTFAVKAINALFREHLFRLGITWHGGTRTLTYEWGSFDHCHRRGSRFVSYEAPDDRVQRRIAEQLQHSAFTDRSGDPFYPAGPTCDLVYPANGAMIDYVYSASWQPSPFPISRCSTNDYPSSMLDHDDVSFKCLMYLIETDYSKMPSSIHLGDTEEIYALSPVDGLVSRNARMALKLIELVEPDVLFDTIPPQRVSPGNPTSFRFFGVGCEYMTNIRFDLYKGDCVTQGSSGYIDSDIVYSKEVAASHPCKGIALWEEPISRHSDDMLTVLMRLPNTIQEGRYCGVLSTEFDQHWRWQHQPHPHLPPQSHVARSRLEEEYYAASGEAVVVGHLRWRFPKIYEEVKPSNLRDGSTQHKPVGFELLCEVQQNDEGVVSSYTSVKNEEGSSNYSIEYVAPIFIGIPVDPFTDEVLLNEVQLEEYISNKNVEDCKQIGGNRCLKLYTELMNESIATNDDIQSCWITTIYINGIKCPSLYLLPDKTNHQLNEVELQDTLSDGCDAVAANIVALPVIS